MPQRHLGVDEVPHALHARFGSSGSGCCARGLRGLLIFRLAKSAAAPPTAALNGYGYAASFPA
eukprot:2620463-Prymnesium_polylepis.1